MQDQYNVTPEMTQRAVMSKRAEAKGRREIAKKVSTLSKISVEYVPPDKLTPNPYNPNRQTEREFELLLKSMEEDGFTQPVIVNMEYMIVDGEHRWRASRVLGMKEIPVVRVDMSEEQMKISTIRHNRARGSHDLALEADVLRELQQLGALDWAKDSLMMDDKSLNLLLADTPLPEQLADAEYSTAWIPKEADNEHVSERQDGAGTVSASAATTQAVEVAEKRREGLAAAKTQNERRAIMEQFRTYQVTVIYAGDEAILVRDILGESPAIKLLDMCRADVASKDGGAAQA